MDKEKELPMRKSTRLETFDYNSAGAYFITICTQNREKILSPPTKPHSVIPQFVSTFKRYCNKEYGGNIWQRGFHDHIIRNREDYEEHLRYICENPMRWLYDELYAEE